MTSGNMGVKHVSILSEGASIGETGEGVREGGGIREPLEDEPETLPSGGAF